MIDNYKKLANAIILVAARDYKAAYKRLRHFPDDQRAQEMACEVTDFFCSREFSILTDLDGPALLGMIRKEIDGQKRFT